jgi:hypothetical protein
MQLQLLRCGWIKKDKEVEAAAPAAKRETSWSISIDRNARKVRLRAARVIFESQPQPGKNFFINQPARNVMFATRVITTSIAMLTLALLVSCGKKEEPKTAAPPAAAAPAPQASPAPSPVAAPAPQVAAPAAVGPPVLARSDGEQTGLSVEVTELKRGSGGTVTLKFTMVNNTKERASFNYNYGDRGLSTIDFNTVGGTHLIDAVNKKKYLVVRDSEKKCVCSLVKSDIPVGERMNLWAKFPAPPEDVKVIAVMIPHFAPMDDVPISP